MAKAGDKKRLEANAAQLARLRALLAAAGALHLAGRLLLRRATAGPPQLAAAAAAAAAAALLYRGVAAALAPHYDAAGELVYAGADRARGGVLEYYFDLLYLLVAAAVGAAYSDHAWWLLAAVPAYALLALWTKVIYPRLGTPAAPLVAPRESEAERKKREKAARQGARAEKFAARRG
jgi:hypothetical protein